MTPPADAHTNPDSSLRPPPLRFTEGEIDGVVVSQLSQHTDSRGWLIELFRGDELAGENLPAMAYLSETNPGVARGPHEHVDQADCFAFVGPGQFRLYLWDARRDSPTFGRCQSLEVGETHRASVIVPPGVVHAYRNIGDAPGWVFNAPNQLYAGVGRQQSVDEIRHEDDPNSPYQLD
jgi:dTDP-4-dehydrorhamnose 3,5-epimerase